MAKFKVLHPFRDTQDKNKTHPNGRLYNVEDEFPATQRKVSEDRINELKGTNNKVGYPVIEGHVPELVEESPVGHADYPWHLGGGYYELSDGSKVRGKDEAEDAEKKLGE